MPQVPHRASSPLLAAWSLLLVALAATQPSATASAGHWRRGVLGSTSQPRPGRLIKSVAQDFADVFSNPNTLLWVPIFSDYNTATAQDGLIGKVDAIPEGSPDNGTLAWYLSVSNRADDAYFGLKAQVTGLPKNKDVLLRLYAEIATCAGDGCSGIGGSPGNSVVFKLGAARVEPSVLLAPENNDLWVFTNVDKGTQINSGPAGSILGDVSSPNASCSWESEGVAPVFFPKRLGPRWHADDEGRRYAIRTSSAGTLWLLAGFDSGYEGLSRLFVKKLVVEIFLSRTT